MKRRKCKMCGGPINRDNKVGICWIAPKCFKFRRAMKARLWRKRHPEKYKAALARSLARQKAERAKTRRVCDVCGVPLVRSNITGVCSGSRKKLPDDRIIYLKPECFRENRRRYSRLERVRSSRRQYQNRKLVKEGRGRHIRDNWRRCLVCNAPIPPHNTTHICTRRNGKCRPLRDLIFRLKDWRRVTKDRRHRHMIQSVFRELAGMTRQQKGTNVKSTEPVRPSS
jgi:hypothetical protein